MLDDEAATRPRDASGQHATRPEYLKRNADAWERWAPWYAARGRAAWQEEELRWGNWGIPERELQLLEDLPPGADIIELGCGTASISAWLTRLGFHAVGVDIARGQLESAAALQQEFGLAFPLIHANAESLNYADASFDCAVAEYGACLWCDPQRWLPEAHRVLVPGGTLIFITNSALAMAATPSQGGSAEDRLVRDYFSTGAVEFPGDCTVEFHPTHGEWINHLRAAGFVLERLIEPRPPARATPRFGFTSVQWARRWPSEDIWVARKTLFSRRKTDG